MLTKQMVVLQGERITAVGAEGRVTLPVGAHVIDLSQGTVLRGLIDAHTHMFNTRGPKTSTEAAMLIAVQNVQADLGAGFTAARDMTSHGNGYGDVAIRDAINQVASTALVSGIHAGHRLECYAGHRACKPAGQHGRSLG